MHVYLLTKKFFSHVKKKVYFDAQMYVYLLVMKVYMCEEKRIYSCLNVYVFSSEEGLFKHEKKKKKKNICSCSHV